MNTCFPLQPITYISISIRKLEEGIFSDLMHDHAAILLNNSSISFFFFSHVIYPLQCVLYLRSDADGNSRNYATSGRIIQIMMHSTLPKMILVVKLNTAQKMKFSIKDFFSKCDQIRRKLRIWSHLLKKSLMENSIFLCRVN